MQLKKIEDKIYTEVHTTWNNKYAKTISLTDAKNIKRHEDLPNNRVRSEAFIKLKSPGQDVSLLAMVTDHHVV